MSPAEASLQAKRKGQVTKGQRQQALRREQEQYTAARQVNKPEGLWKIEDGELKVWMHPGQLKVWNSKKRIIVMIAGSQSGKTSLGPLWLFRELQNRGVGDYLCVSPNYTLYKLKMLPEFRKLYERTLHLGQWRASDKTFYHYQDNPEEIERSRTIFGSAENPESLESATAKAAWLDEAGQNQFRIGAWEAVLRRLAFFRGRVLITTTPYNLGWVKGLYDRWKAGDPDIEVVQFPSTLNPNFPPEEFRRAQATMPSWRFKMFYMGEFERPAGVIFDCFDSAYKEQGGHKVHPFEIPDDWPRTVGLDFGGVNTAKLFIAQDPNSPQAYVYKETLRGGVTISEHSEEIKEEMEGKNFVSAYGGSKTEGQWREDFSDQGLYVQEPEVANVEVGIQRAYALFKTNTVYIFDTCTGFLDELATYSRKLDDDNMPTEVIDHKERYHFVDAFRYAAPGITMADFSWGSIERQQPTHQMTALVNPSGESRRVFGPSVQRAATAAQASWSALPSGPPSYKHNLCGFITIADQVLRAALATRPPKVLFCAGCQDNFVLQEFDIRKE